jgi:hypothetical protein
VQDHQFIYIPAELEIGMEKHEQQQMQKQDQQKHATTPTTTAAATTTSSIEIPANIARASRFSRVDGAKRVGQQPFWSFAKILPN